MIFAYALSTLGSGLTVYALLAFEGRGQKAVLALAMTCLTLSLGLQVPPLLGVTYP